MSVLIKIPMPGNCAECPCLRHDSIDGVNAYQCNITFGIRKNIDRKPKWCPLVDLEKHGDLIDAESLNIHDISPVNGFCVMGVTEEDIGLAEKVIEAEDK